MSTPARATEAILPVGDPTSQGSAADGSSWADYACGTRMELDTEGTLFYIYSESVQAAHGVAQYNKHTSGVSMLVYSDGVQRQDQPGGMIITAFPDGTTTQQAPNGMYMETRPDGSRIQTSKDGTSIEVLPDGTRIQRNAKTGSKHTDYPDGRAVQTDTDGSEIETLPDGGMFATDTNGERKPIKLVEGVDALGKMMNLYEVVTNEGPSLEFDGRESAEFDWMDEQAAVALQSMARMFFARKYANKLRVKHKALRDSQEVVPGNKEPLPKTIKLPNDELAVASARSQAQAQKDKLTNAQVALQNSSQVAVAIPVPSKGADAAVPSMGFMAMKKHLKKAGVAADLIDKCLGKVELENLASQMGIALG